MHPVDIVLIDLDGTISDSSPGMLTGFRKVFDRFDMEQPSDESIRRHFGPPLAVTWREVYGMTDEQIAELIAETAASQASMHPDFARLAARVAVSRLHARTPGSSARASNLGKHAAGPVATHATKHAAKQPAKQAAR